MKTFKRYIIIVQSNKKNAFFLLVLSFVLSFKNKEVNRNETHSTANVGFRFFLMQHPEYSDLYVTVASIINAEKLRTFRDCVHDKYRVAFLLPHCLSFEFFIKQNTEEEYPVLGITALVFITIDSLFWSWKVSLN